MNHSLFENEAGAGGARHGGNVAIRRDIRTVSGVKTAGNAFCILCEITEVSKMQHYILWFRKILYFAISLRFLYNQKCTKAWETQRKRRRVRCFFYCPGFLL